MSERGSMIETTRERLRTYPMWLRALLAVLVVAAVGLLWHDFVWAPAARWNEAVDRDLARLAEAAERQRELDRPLQEAIAQLGPVEVPSPEQAAVVELQQAINEVLAEHGVTGERVTSKGQIKLGRGSLPGLVRPEFQAVRVTNELQFMAGQEQAMAVIRALEARPEIEAISTARIARSTDIRRPKQVTVNLTVEAWAIPAGAATFRTGDTT